MADDSIDLLRWPDHSVIQILAHELWVTRGCPLWDDWTDWHKAERLAGEVSESPVGALRECTKWRAAYLWHLDGRPIGRDRDFWLQAEKEVRCEQPYLVRVMAYENWEKRGRPLWDAETDWSKTERRLGATA